MLQEGHPKDILYFLSHAAVRIITRKVTILKLNLHIAAGSASEEPAAQSIGMPDRAFATTIWGNGGGHSCFATSPLGLSRPAMEMLPGAEGSLLTCLRLFLNAGFA